MLRMRMVCQYHSKIRRVQWICGHILKIAYVHHSIYKHLIHLYVLASCLRKQFANTFYNFNQFRNAKNANLVIKSKNYQLDQLCGQTKFTKPSKHRQNTESKSFLGPIYCGNLAIVGYARWSRVVAQLIIRLQCSMKIEYVDHSYYSKILQPAFIIHWFSHDILKDQGRML